MTFMRRDFNDWNFWGMIIHRLKFITCKVLEVYWICKELSKNFMGSVFFLGHHVNELLLISVVISQRQAAVLW